MSSTSAWPRRNEILLGVLMAGLGVLEVSTNTAIRPLWAGLFGAVVAGCALAWRRVAPFATVVVISVAWCVEILAGVPIQQPVAPFVAIVVAMYTVTAYAPLERLFAALAVLAIADAIAVTSQHQGLDNFLFGWIWVSAAVLVGWLVRARVEEAARLERRTVQLEREREEAERRAVEAERSRIARELHDVISHSLGVIVVQAGAAEEVLRHDPAQAAAPIRAIQETGRRALDEMGHMLGVLRDARDEIGLAPQPGLDDLESLVAETRAAGLPVELAVGELDGPLPAGVELSVYRIVQEALTNARKHGGDATAHVSVARDADHVVVEIADDGDGAGQASGTGLGLVGMRERVSVFGGTLEAAPRPTGGFLVRASLPLGERV